MLQKLSFTAWQSTVRKRWIVPLIVNVKTDIKKEKVREMALF